MLQKARPPGASRPPGSWAALQQDVLGPRRGCCELQACPRHSLPLRPHLVLAGAPGSSFLWPQPPLAKGPWFLLRFIISVEGPGSGWGGPGACGGCVLGWSAGSQGGLPSPPAPGRAGRGRVGPLFDLPLSWNILPSSSLLAPLAHGLALRWLLPGNLPSGFPMCLGSEVGAWAATARPARTASSAQHRVSETLEAVANVFKCVASPEKSGGGVVLGPHSQKLAVAGQVTAVPSREGRASARMFIGPAEPH